MNQDQEEKDKQGRIIRRPNLKFDPWGGKWQKSMPKIGPGEVYEDDNFTPPNPSPAEVEQMKKFSVMRNGANLFQALPTPPAAKAVLEMLLQQEAERPADSFKDVPEEKKASAGSPFAAMLQGIGRGA